MTGRVQGKVAFITGAARGQGRSHAIRLAQEGADIIAVDLCESIPSVDRFYPGATEADLAETVKAVEALDRRIVAAKADVRDYPALKAALDDGVAQLGHVDIVVNNAGGSSFMTGFRDLRLSGWDKIMRLNVNSTVYVCHAVGRHLLERGTGSVINVASVAGVASSPLMSPYGAAKAAVISLTKSLAVEWAPQGVRVNALCPGWTATELNRLRRRSEPVLCYDVEVCPQCAWHHLTRKYPAGGRREGQRAGRAL